MTRKPPARHACSAAVMTALAMLGFAQSAAARTAWPGRTRAAIVLTYDDALGSQLANAVPALDAAGLKATFFLSGVRQADVDAWRDVAAHGHELGNHTIFHPCAAATFPADPRYTLEAYRPASILREIEQQNVLLAALDGRDRHGFATPCGQTVAGGTDYIGPLKASGLVSYVRGVSETPADLGVDGATRDAMHIPARGFAEGTTGEQLIAYARQAQAAGGVAVFLFHGIGGDHLQVSNEAHRMLINWLRAHRRDLWTTTLQQALDWERTHRVSDVAGGPVADRR